MDTSRAAAGHSICPPTGCQPAPHQQRSSELAQLWCIQPCRRQLWRAHGGWPRQGNWRQHAPGRHRAHHAPPLPALHHLELLWHRHSEAMQPAVLLPVQGLLCLLLLLFPLLLLRPLRPLLLPPLPLLPLLLPLLLLLQQLCLGAAGWLPAPDPGTRCLQAVEHKRWDQLRRPAAAGSQKGRRDGAGGTAKRRQRQPCQPAGPMCDTLGTLNGRQVHLICRPPSPSAGAAPQCRRGLRHVRHGVPPPSGNRPCDHEEVHIATRCPSPPGSASSQRAASSLSAKPLRML